MKKIFKYPLPVKEKCEIQLPIGAKIIRVGDVDGLFWLWAIVDPDQEQTEASYIEFYKTGQPIDNDNDLVYLGICCLFIMQELGLYIFERINPNQPFTT